jgi:[protein-PII] uridylyltransferase
VVTERDPQKALIGAARARAGALLDAGGGGLAASHAMSDALDDLVRSVLPDDLPAGMAVVATGGWGRRETAPFSDIDVLFLCAEAPGDEAKALADRVLYPLWDGGVEVGHAVRSIAEAAALAHDDLATLTALLDSRPIAGDAALLVELSRHLGRGDTNVYVRRLAEAKTARHDRFGDTLYLLEPNLKHGQGGLRDLATGLWAAKIRWKVHDFVDLCALGQISARQVAALTEAREFLLRVRGHVHMFAQRRLDQLTFEMQEAVAPRMYADARVPPGETRPAVAPAVEALMRRYYLHAKSVVREVDRMLERAVVPPQRAPRVVKIDASFTAFNGRLSAADGAIFRDRPAEMVRLFQVALAQGLPVYGHTKEMVAERVAVDGPRLLADPAAQRGFLELLVDPRDRVQPSILEEMHELGLLSALMPEFAPTTGRVQHDLYHVYTVDQHQLYAVAQMKRIARGELGKELQAIHAEVGDLRPLYLATLLHDVGKPLGKGHSEKGSRLATSIARRLGLGDGVARIEFLVRHHLLMSHLSQRRDLDDTAMIAKFARVMKDEETMRELYLLTLCDTAMTAPGNLNEWKSHLLRELYQRTRAHLKRGPALAGAERSARVRARRRRVAALLGQDEASLAGLPDRYIAMLPPGTIAQHVRLLNAGSPVAIAVVARPKRGYSELLVVAPDTPGLLMKIAGVLAAGRIDILGANIHTSEGHALDVFYARDRAGRAIAKDDPRWKSVEEDLRRVVAGDEDVAALVERRREKSQLPPRVTPEVVTEVQSDNDASDDFTVIDVYTQDRLGVLYAITRTLTELGLDIGLSKVATEADRACDTFYVRDQAGRKLDADKLRDVTGKLLEALK